ncbi:MAG TPA: GNAT family N-acetyltransferase [Gammaproteobacteria bacterium]|nr:GNAT family N-acetyltransferase [Gammaproteobacteria bacterium]
MINLRPPHRPATPEDAHAMAELVNMAGENLPLYTWDSMAGPGESAWDVGISRARREHGGFSWRNTILREDSGSIIACLIGYPLEDTPQPVDYGEMPSMFVPLQQLEDEVPGTWYVNVLATYPEYRGKGYGSELLDIAEQLAVDTNRNGISVIVSNANTGARRLYKKQGYREYARRAMVKEDWENPGAEWILLSKEIRR